MPSVRVVSWFLVALALNSVLVSSVPAEAWVGTRMRKSAVTADVVPDAIDWPNFSALFNPVSATRTFTGINQSISVRIRADSGGTAGVSYSLNGGAYVQLSGYPDNVTVTISNGDTLTFRLDAGCGSRLIEVFNDSDSGTLLDSTTGTATDC